MNSDDNIVTINNNTNNSSESVYQQPPIIHTNMVHGFQSSLPRHRSNNHNNNKNNSYSNIRRSNHRWNIISQPQNMFSSTFRNIITFVQWIVIIIILVWFIIASYVMLMNHTIFGCTKTTISSSSGLYDNSINHNNQPFNFNHVASHTKHLIIVAGHSVTISGHLYDADHDENDWYLLEYQKHHGLPQAIIYHIMAGIYAASIQSDALLIFSGGQTRAITGPESEGSSYYRVADVMNLWNTTKNHSSITTRSSTNSLLRGNDQHSTTSNTIRARTAIEEYATDSFQNLLFSICRFYEITGSYPITITMVSYTFKQHRFETLHIPAIRWPDSKFIYIGVDPESSTGFNLSEATIGELENAAKPFEDDPYGCHSKILQDKRKERNPFSRTPPYDISCPDMRDILHYCGPNRIDGHLIPWSQ